MFWCRRRQARFVSPKNHKLLSLINSRTWHKHTQVKRTCSGVTSHQFSISFVCENTSFWIYLCESTAQGLHVTRLIVIWKFLHRLESAWAEDVFWLATWLPVLWMWLAHSEFFISQSKELNLFVLKPEMVPWVGSPKRSHLIFAQQIAPVWNSSVCSAHKNRWTWETKIIFVFPDLIQVFLSSLTSKHTLYSPRKSVVFIQHASRPFPVALTWCDNSGHWHTFQMVLDGEDADVVLHP